MNQELNNFSLRNILTIWTVMTIFLVISGLLVFAYDFNIKAFISILNTINLFLFLLFYLFRKSIEGIIVKLLEGSKNLSVNIEYRYEKEIGLTLIYLFTAFCGIILFVAFYDIEMYSLLIKEDGVVEYGSALFWFLSAIIMTFYTLNITRGKINRYQLFFNILLIAFFIVCSGEEISWGQRIFGIETPELMSAINVQNEINLHNIGSISVFSNVFFIITITFFLIVPFLINKYVQIKQVLYFIHFPIPNKFAIYIFIGSLCVWIIIGLRFGTLGFHPFSFYPEQFYNQMDDEIFELLAAYSFFCFSSLNSIKRITITE